MAAALSGVNPGERNIKGKVSSKDTAIIAKLRSSEELLLREIARIEGPVREKLLQAAEKSGRKGPIPPKPIAGWNFTTGLSDVNGKLPVTLKGSAKQTGEGLILDGRGFATTVPLPFDLADKTLEVWMKLGDLNQRGGGAITVQDNRGVLFDSIVFGERQPKRWMAGSNGFVRTKPFNGSEEAEGLNKPVHVAIVYQADGTVLPNSEVEQVIHTESARHGIQRRFFSVEEIQNRVMLAMINEAARVLEDGIALRPLDIDMVKIFGYGFPRWRGGPMHFADQTGLDEILKLLKDYAMTDDFFWRPSSLLEQLVREGRTFSDLN